MLAYLMPPSVTPMEMIIVAVIALVLFGKRVPEVTHRLGRSLEKLWMVAPSFRSSDDG